MDALYILENDTQLRKKLVSVMQQQKSAMWQKKQRRCRMRDRKRFPFGKNSKLPMHQERTETQNCAKVTNTTNNK